MLVFLLDKSIIMVYSSEVFEGVTMSLGKSPALPPGQIAADGLDSRLRGNDLCLGKDPILNDSSARPGRKSYRPAGRTQFGPTARKKNSFWFLSRICG